MLKVSVKSLDVKDKSGTGKKSGRAYSFREQRAWAFLEGKPFPVEFVLILPDDQSGPYPLGEYLLAPSSFYVGDFGRIECNPRLVVAKAA